MSHVLSLISNPAKPELTPGLVAQVKSLLPDMWTTSDGTWLAPGIAWECTLSTAEQTNPAVLTDQIRTAMMGTPIDINILPETERRKRLLLADMDSTIIEQECLDEIAAFAGVKDKIAAITARAMAGELDFEAALKERVSYLKDLPETVLDQVIQDHITLAPGAETLVQTMNAAGAITVLVSGGFTYFTSRIAAACGFAHHFGNTLIIDNGILTGDVGAPILGKQAKQQTLRRFRDDAGLNGAQTMAIGDGANDKDMIAEAGLGVAVHGKPVLRQAAAAAIDHGDLTALLYLQGYAQTDFAGA